MVKANVFKLRMDFMSEDSTVEYDKLITASRASLSGEISVVPVDGSLKKPIIDGAVFQVDNSGGVFSNVHGLASVGMLDTMSSFNDAMECASDALEFNNWISSFYIIGDDRWIVLCE